MSLPISIQVMKESRIDNERYYTKRDRARKMFEPLRLKYKGYGLCDIPIEILSDDEKLLLYKCYRCFMKINDSSLIVYGNDYTGYMIENQEN